MAKVGEVVYTHFGGEPANGVFQLTWLCPKCEKVAPVHSERLELDLQCSFCGLIMVPALGLNERVLGGHVLAGPEGNFRWENNSWDRTSWWATRTWKYTIKFIGERPGRFQMLYEDEIEGEYFEVKDPGTFDETGMLESLWPVDPIGDWEQSEAERQEYQDNNIADVSIKKKGPASTMTIRDSVPPKSVGGE